MAAGFSGVLVSYVSPEGLGMAVPFYGDKSDGPAATDAVGFGVDGIERVALELGFAVDVGDVEFVCQGADGIGDVVEGVPSDLGVGEVVGWILGFGGDFVGEFVEDVV